MDYHHKYIKYKTKYDDLNKIYFDDLTGGSRYECDPSKKFSQICTPADNGMYKSNISCINDCEIKYINHQLRKENLKTETYQFASIIKDLLEDKLKIYIKGGTALGLKILQMLYEKYEDDSLEKYFNQFVNLDLIRDWDFVAYTDKVIDSNYMKMMNAKAKKYLLVLRAKTFILYQTRNPIKLDNQVLFEIAILNGNKLSELELPMTTMKIPINRHNINYIFILAQVFYSRKLHQTPIDLDIIKRVIPKINIMVSPSQNGLFITNGQTFDKGNLSEDLVSFIMTFEDFDPNLPQFLITEIEEPHRIFLRLYEKNIPKADKIANFLQTSGISQKRPSWLIHGKQIDQIMNLFIDKLGAKMLDIYLVTFNKTNNIELAMKAVSEFISGVNLTRIEIEYDKFGPKGLAMVKKLFYPLYHQLQPSLTELPDNIMFVHILNLLVKKRLFD